MASPEQHLKSDLLAIKEELPDYIDNDFLDGVITSCTNLPDSEVEQFMGNFFGPVPSLSRVIQQYLDRRRSRSYSASAGASTATGGDLRGSLQAYMKPKIESGSAQEMRPAGRPSHQDNSTQKPEQEVVAAARGGRKGKKKTVNLADVDQGKVVFKQGEPCDCQASKHALVNNCLGCGKIVCEQEGEGPCFFCGRIVAKEGSELALQEQQAHLESSAPGPLKDREAEAKAVAFKDRLVEYDRTSAQRTAVIDDQVDYFEIDGDGWLTEEERQLLRQREEEKRRREEERRRKVVVTFDLIGRKVMLEDPRTGAYVGGDSAPGFSFEQTGMLVDSSQGRGDSPSGFRAGMSSTNAAAPIVSSNGQSVNSAELAQIPFTMAPSDNLRGAAPIFTGEALAARDTGKSKKGGAKGESSSSSHSVVARSIKQAPRVQYDHSLGASLGRALGLVSNATTAPSQQGKGQDASKQGPFDICPGLESGGAVPQLIRPSFHRGARQAQAAAGSASVLQEGMALLKGWLSLQQQVQVVQACRHLGLGPGGFYTPKMTSGAELRLKMMCLGKHWEPNLKAYEDRRSFHDNATPPKIPAELSQLAQQAVKRAQAAAGSNLPGMTPQVCIVNFYAAGGSLGMHQDKDESAASIRRGSPVVSFSIGDAAVFLYGKERMAETAKRVVLESGDALLFGGSSRLLFHGVPEVLPNTCPREVVEACGLRPGRLNLTFREL